MARPEDLEPRLEELITRAVEQVHKTAAEEFPELSEQLPWAVTRALVHRAVHFAAAAPGVEFCSLASYLGEMIGHAHQLLHREHPKGAGRRELH
jgi:hypothetical protein